MRHRRFTPFGPILVALMLLTSWSAMLASADSSSGSGSVTVEIVPPGSLPPPAAPGKHDDPQSALPENRTAPEVMPAYGTLSTIIMWLPNPADGQNQVHGLLSVQDHRASADGWTIRLLGNDPLPLNLVKVHVGGAGFGIPDWLYVGIHAWDVAVGASLAESPQVVTAPQGTGYSLTVHRLWINMDPLALDATGSLHTLLLILTFAP